MVKGLKEVVMMGSKANPDREALLEAVRQVLPSARYQHTLGVVKVSIDLARRFGADVEKAEVAAILHDYAKYHPLDEMRHLIETNPKIPNDLLDYGHELWHAFVGAVLVEDQLGINDEEILNAIRYHTTGRPEMTLVEKVVFLADYIEPGRQFPGVDLVRRLATTDLDQAVKQALQQTVSFLEGKGKKVYPLTKAALDWFLLRQSKTQ